MKVHRKNQVKSLALLLSVVLLLTVTVGGTLAYLFVKTEPLTNELEMGGVTCQVENDKTVTNTGNVKAYIRAAVVVNWVVEGGVHWQQPEFKVSGNDWVKGNDGYYYYKLPVDPKTATTPAGATSALSVEVKGNAPTGSSGSQIQILAEAIQVGGGAAAAAWGATNIPTGWQ